MGYLQASVICVLALGAAAAPRPALTGRSAAAGNTTSSGQERVEGGVPVMIGKLKYVCSVRYLNVDICTCSIVNLNHALTSARCVYNLPGAIGVTIAAGSHVKGTGPVFAADEITVHPKFNSISHSNDAAVLHTVDPMQGNGIRNVVLPTAGQILNVGTGVVVSGYGISTPPMVPLPPLPPGPPYALPSNVLLQAYLKTITQQSCAQAYLFSNVLIDSSSLCAVAPVPAGACVGDSGSPLVRQGDGSINDVQFGIASSVLGCGNPTMPNVFTSVAHPDIRNFIGDAAKV